MKAISHNPLKAVKNEAISVRNVPGIRKGVALFDGSQASPACPYESNMKVKMSVQHWWNDTDRRKPEIGGEKLVSLPLCPP
jgi:hypothetical protein